MGNNLKKLRDAKGWTHQEAADAMGVSRGSFIKLERGERRLTHEYISRAAAAFEVAESVVISDSTSLPIVGLVGAGAAIEPDFGKVPPGGLHTVDLPFPVPDGLIGFEVRGDAMLPRYDDGDVVVVWREQRRPTEGFIGEEAAVRTEEGRRYLKHVLHGPRSGTYALHSFNAKPIDAARIAWLGEIYATVRAAQVRRIDAQPSAGRRPRSRETLEKRAR